MASAFLSSILSKTNQVLGFAQRSAVSPFSSSDPRSSVLKDLEKLERTLKRIQAVLHDAEEREIRDESVKLWLKELKEVAYEADDVLDEYQYEVLRAHVEGRASCKRKRVEGDDEEEVSGSLSTLVVSIPEGMGDRIREIRERLDEISQDRERLRLREEEGERRVLEAPYPAPTSHMVDESSIYGRERDKQEVIDLLFSKGVGNSVSVIPIVGKGGLGKTTIAQLVYNDPKVKQYFDLTGWVCVSDDFDVPRLTKAIIESLPGSSCDSTQLSKLQDTLKEKLKEKRVLLVLDDVWNEQQSRWESLRNPFVGAETVTIIMTCRNDSVAEIMQTMRPYHPDCLSPEQSWSLFRHYAFGGQDPEEQPRLADMGKQIVKKCSGLPLAVKSIGSLMRYMADEDSWMDVIRSDIWEVDENNEILPALRLSYSRMPAHLKPCFVYFSMFPKDYVFDKDELVRLWMAQGYIQTCGGRRRMEDIGNEYFNDLQRRSFFDSYYDILKPCFDYCSILPEVLMSDRLATKFRDKNIQKHGGGGRRSMNDIGKKYFNNLQRRSSFDSYRSKFKMHDMMHDLAKSIAGNECWAIVDKKIHSLPSDVRLDKVRHLYVGLGDEEEFVKSLRSYNFSALRTLLLWGSTVLLAKRNHCARIIPEIIKNLPLLRGLRTLQFFWERKDEIPDLFGNLKHLRHLYIQSHYMEKVPESICLLYHLQTLILDFPNVAELPDGLNNLTNLRYLHITSNKIEKLPESICLIYHLQTLVLDCRKLAELLDLTIRNCPQLRLLSKEGLPFNLQYLHIKKCQQLTSLPEIQNLTSLRRLIIKNCPKLSLLSKEGLPSNLQDVHIEECQQLTSLSEMQNLTSLKRLIIKNCPKLQIMAEDHLSSMPDEVKIVDCPGLRNWCQIQRINCIQVASGNKLTISNTWESIMSGFDDLTSIEYLCFSNSWTCFLETDSKLELKELTIWGWMDITPLGDLPMLPSLRSLIITNCPRIHCLPWHSILMLSSSLESLVVDSCEHLRYLPLAQLNRDAFEELQLVNCPKLEWVQGLNYIFLTKILRIERCPRLRFPQYDLPKFTSLRSLVIKDCPGFQFLPRGLFPSTLESLVVDSCEDLTFLPLAQQNRDALCMLQLVNCPKLIWVEGLDCFFFPEILRIKRCPQLHLPQDDRQPSIPPRVEIAEETENKETIDDGTQEKQVLDCVKIEHANSA